MDAQVWEQPGLARNDPSGGRLVCTTSTTCHEHLADAGTHQVELSGGGLVTVYADGRVSVTAPHPLDEDRFSPTGVLVNAGAGFVEVHPGGPSLSHHSRRGGSGDVAVPLPRPAPEVAVTSQSCLMHELLEVFDDRARSGVPGKVFVSLRDGSVLREATSLAQRDEQYRTYLASELIAKFNGLG